MEKIKARDFETVMALNRELLETFSVLDDVFSEPDAFAPMQMSKSLGRCYREWKRVRKVLDPDFDPHRYNHEV